MPSRYQTNFIRKHWPIEDITWPPGDMKFLFKFWKIFHEWVQWTSEIFFSTREEKFHISKQPCNVLFKHQLNTNEMPNHFTSIVFGLKGAVYYEAIAMVIFSHVKITCYFHTWSPPPPPPGPCPSLLSLATDDKKLSQFESDLVNTDEDIVPQNP